MDEGLANVFDKLEPLSKGQERLFSVLRSEDVNIVGVFGPTGTGKSYVTLAYGLQSLSRKRYKRIVIARPIIDVTTGQEVTITSDPEHYVKLASEYIADIASSLAGEDVIGKLVEARKLVLVDPHLLRGRSFDDSLIILDDAQNAAPETIVEIITRLGNNSRLIIAGDPIFQKGPRSEGIVLAREILMGEENAEIIDLGVKDIIRPGARLGLRLLLELQVRRRRMSEIEERIAEEARNISPDADIINVAYLVDLKKKWGIESDHVPDALILVKEGHLGRLIGHGGERIARIEEETGLSLRAVQLTLDFKEYIRAIHPVAWVHKHVIDFDFAGPELRLLVSKGNLGPVIGQKGIYIKFVDEVFRNLFGFGVYVVESREGGRRKR
ncbi:MAG: PhoH family protein [Desulfurococcales archaeon]|nr:PhoH family protein [Desulfurococcales archaeon]